MYFTGLIVRKEKQDKFYNHFLLGGSIQTLSRRIPAKEILLVMLNSEDTD